MEGKDDWKEYHNASGLLKVSAQRLSWGILECFKKACIQSGIPLTKDFNCGTNEGVNYFLVNQFHGWRQSAAKAFLYPLLYGREYGHGYIDDENRNNDNSSSNNNNKNKDNGGSRSSRLWLAIIVATFILVSSASRGLCINSPCAWNSWRDFSK